MYAHYHKKSHSIIEWINQSLLNSPSAAFIVVASNRSQRIYKTGFFVSSFQKRLQKPSPIIPSGLTKAQAQGVTV
jgi:menaquinone-dependent protoporphyrinogen IX oxidase